jgi:hypothetical protein
MGGGKSSVILKRPGLPGLLLIFGLSGIFVRPAGAFSFRDTVYKKFSNDTVCWE